MKRFSNILVALGVTFLLLSVGMKSEADAQPPENCDSDPCYQTQTWTAPIYSPAFQLGSLPDCADCWVKIVYRTRNNSTNPACSSLPAVEYQLLFVVVSGSCYYSPCNLYVPFNMQQAYADAMIQFLASKGYAPTPPNECGPWLKDFTIINCFREDMDLEGNIILRTCAEYTCCKQDIRICKVNGVTRIESDITLSEGNCANDPNYPNDCMTICDWIEQATPLKRALNDTRIHIENPLKISPNPILSDVLNFNLDSKSKIEEVYLIDPHGKFIMFNTKDIINTNSLSLANHSSGSYMLVIKTEDKETHYCNFILNK